MGGMDPAALKSALHAQALAEGFAAMGVTRPDAIPEAPVRLAGPKVSLCRAGTRQARHARGTPRINGAAPSFATWLADIGLFALRLLPVQDGRPTRAMNCPTRTISPVSA